MQFLVLTDRKALGFTFFCMYVIFKPIDSAQRQSIIQSISLIATLRPESQIANDMQLK